MPCRCKHYCVPMIIQPRYFHWFVFFLAPRCYRRKGRYISQTPECVHYRGRTPRKWHCTMYEPDPDGEPVREYPRTGVMIGPIGDPGTEARVAEIKRLLQTSNNAYDVLPHLQDLL